MAKGTHNIPPSFKGENRFLSIGKFEGFTSRGLAYLAVGSSVTILLNQAFSKIGYGMVGIIVGAVITLFLVALGMIKIPASMYLYNAGKTLDLVLFNIIKRRLKRCIYTKTLHPHRPREETMHGINK